MKTNRIKNSPTAWPIAKNLQWMFSFIKFGEFHKECTMHMHNAILASINHFIHMAQYIYICAFGSTCCGLRTIIRSGTKYNKNIWCCCLLHEDTRKRERDVLCCFWFRSRFSVANILMKWKYVKYLWCDAIDRDYRFFTISPIKCMPNEIWARDSGQT